MPFCQQKHCCVFFFPNDQMVTLETNAKIYESMCITECKALRCKLTFFTILHTFLKCVHAQFYIFYTFTILRFYNFQASLNRRANACSCLIKKDFCTFNSALLSRNRPLSVIENGRLFGKTSRNRLHLILFVNSDEFL
jgi:hypothetical protein